MTDANNWWSGSIMSSNELKLASNTDHHESDS
jgi:hypothetical protein